MSLDLPPDLFPRARGYLNTASLGLPPTPVGEALAAAIETWSAGAADPPGYDAVVAAARESFAGLVGVPASSVAVGSQVSGFVGLVAASLPAGSVVVCPEGEFTSVLFPFLVQQPRGVTVRVVPFASLAEAITPDVAAVAFSLVRSNDGRLADLEGITAAATAAGVLILVDATQAAGWLPIRAGEIDVLVAGAYKWLLSPRGTAFMTVRPGLLDQIVPAHAGWYAGGQPWDSIYGMPLRLAADARRFDLSPAWLSWVGTAPALGVIAGLGIEAIHRHDTALAASCSRALGLPFAGSAIVSVPLAAGFDPGRLEGITAAMRAGNLRLCFHLYNTPDDVDRVVDALQGWIRPPAAVP